MFVQVRKEIRYLIYLLIYPDRFLLNSIKLIQNFGYFLNSKLKIFGQKISKFTIFYKLIEYDSEYN